MADDPIIEPVEPPVGDPTPPEPVAPPAPPADPVVEPPAWTPPTQQEWEAFQREKADQATALKKANAEAAERRKALKELQQQHEDEDTKARREATEAALAQVKPVAIRAEAKSALLAAKANPERVAALTRLLDLSAIDIDGDQVTGLDTQVDQLKADYPEFFVTEVPPAPPAPPKAPRINQNGRLAPPDDKPKSIGELVAAQFNQQKK